MNSRDVFFTESEKAIVRERLRVLPVKDRQFLAEALDYVPELVAGVMRRWVREAAAGRENEGRA